MHQTNPYDYIIWYKNQSLLSCLLRFLTKGSKVNLLNLEQTQVYIIFVALAVLLFGLIFILCKKDKLQASAPAYLAEISLVVILMVILSPLAWKHTFVQLIIPQMALLYYVIYLRPDDKLTKGLLIASFTLNTVLNPELTKSFSETIQLLSSVTFGTLLLYAALLRVNLKLCKP